MARVQSIGFELQSATAGVEVVSIVGVPTISTTVKRSGAASMRFNAAGSEVSAKLMPTLGTGTDLAHRVYLLFKSFPASLTKVIQLQDATGDHTSIRVATDGTLELWDDSAATKTGSSSPALKL
jgi:hypothetical protein